MAKSDSAQWRNRIVAHGFQAAADFKFNPNNWREHPQIQRDALNEIFTKIGWVNGVIVNRTTGNLIDGHARIEEALKTDKSMQIPFVTVDLTEDEEREMLLLLDPIGSLAVTNNEKFSELMDSVEIDTSGLLDVIASMSRESLIETAELEKQGGGLGELLSYLRFGGVQIPLTDEELAELTRRYEAYVEEHQTFYGFPAALLGLK